MQKGLPLRSGSLVEGTSMSSENKSTVSVEINGKIVSAAYGTRLLDVCTGQEIRIPTLCHHPALPGYAACRLCMVELRYKDRSKLVASCEYPLFRDGETFYTDSEKVWNSRMMSAELLLARAPESRDLLEKILGRPVHSRESFAALDVDNKKCVLCGLCYRLCYAQGTAAIYTTGRGANKTVATPFHEANDECIGCASCAAICPTGAIAMREPAGKRAIWRQLFELEKCPDCGTPHATARMIKYMKERTDLPGETVLLCPSCRSRRLGEKMLTGTSGRPTAP